MLSCKLLLKEFSLLSTSLLNETMGFNIVVIKTTSLLYQDGSFSTDIMVTFNEINTKLWKYGMEFAAKLLLCVGYLVLSNFQTNFCSLLVLLFGTISRQRSLDKVNLSFNFEARTACRCETAGVNISGKSKNWPFLSPLQQVSGHNLHNMQHTKLIFGPQRQNKLLFLLLKEKFDLTMLWGIVGRKGISMVNCSKFLFIIWLLLRQHFWKLGSHDLELLALLFALFGTLPKSTVSGPF